MAGVAKECEESGLERHPGSVPGTPRRISPRYRRSAPCAVQSTALDQALFDGCQRASRPREQGVRARVRVGGLGSTPSENNAERGAERLAHGLWARRHPSNRAWTFSESGDERRAPEPTLIRLTLEAFQESRATGLEHPERPSIRHVCADRREVGADGQSERIDRSSRRSRRPVASGRAMDFPEYIALCKPVHPAHDHPLRPVAVAQ